MEQISDLTGEIGVSRESRSRQQPGSGVRLCGAWGNTLCQGLGQGVRLGTDPHSVQLGLTGTWPRLFKTQTCETPAPTDPLPLPLPCAGAAGRSSLCWGHRSPLLQAVCGVALHPRGGHRALVGAERRFRCPLRSAPAARPPAAPARARKELPPLFSSGRFWGFWVAGGI